MKSRKLTGRRKGGGSSSALRVCAWHPASRTGCAAGCRNGALYGFRRHTAGVMLGAAEVLGNIALAVMNTSSFAQIRNRAFGFFKQYRPPAEVSRALQRRPADVRRAACFRLACAGRVLVDARPADNQINSAIGGDLVRPVSLFVSEGDSL